MKQKPRPSRPPQRVPTGVWIAMLGVLAIAVLLVILSSRAFRGVPEPSEEPVPQSTVEPSADPAGTMPDHSAPVPAPDASSASVLHWAERLRDATLILRERRQAARALARIGTDESMAALRAALENSSSALKAFIAESVGESPHPSARDWLLEWLRGSDEALAIGAARGLALRGDADAVDALGGVLFSERQSEAVRMEAARALGELNSTEATSLLARAMKELTYSGNEELVESLLEGLTRRPYSETASIFGEYLASENVPSELKVQAIEALAEVDGDVSALLLRHARDPDPEVRLAAATALALAESAGDLGPQILGLLTGESDPSVRQELYRALAMQEKPDAATVLALARNERNENARLAAYEVLARAMRGSPGPELTAFFNGTAIPELQRAALAAEESTARLAAIIALSRAGTPQAMAALQQIAQTSPDPGVVNSARIALQSVR